MKTWHKIILWILTVVILFTITAYGANFIYYRLLLNEDYLKWKQGIESQIAELQDQIEKLTYWHKCLVNSTHSLSF